MESPAAETSPATSGLGFKGMFSKARRGGKDTSSTPSINGTDNSSEGHGVRSSIDSVRDKLRPSRESSIDDGTIVSKPRKLSKLIPGRMKRKKKKNQEGEDDQQDDEDGQDDHVEQPATSTQPRPQPNTGRRSQSTLGGDGDSSLITYDSDTESPLGSPPPLTSHPSHAGYITSSSPLIKTSNVTDPLISTRADGFSTKSSSALKSTTFPIEHSTSTELSDLAPRHASTVDSQQSEQSLSAPGHIASKNRRGISPGAKIKNVFATGSRKADGSPSSSPDRASVRSSGSGNTLGGLFGTGEKRNSVNSRKGSRLSESAAVVPQPANAKIRNSGSKKPDLPKITIIPKTPPSTGLDAPLTTVTPPTPTDQRLDHTRALTPKAQSSFSAGTNPNTVVSASGNMITHRRIRSDSATHSPSKLSNTILAPLTPTIEETKVTGTRTPLSQGTSVGAGGFFSSVFSMAQNATSTLTGSLSNNNQSRPRSLTFTADEEPPRETETSMTAVNDGEEVQAETKKKLAIDTLGTGDLSLSHLGIATDAPMTSDSITGSFPTVADELSERSKKASLRRDEAAARAEDITAARAISDAYSEKTSNDKTSMAGAEGNTPRTASKTSYETKIAGEKTPPNGSVFEGEPHSRRSGSVRSRVGAVTRRHRNSSSATGNTIGTIGTINGSSQANLGNPTKSASTPKLTGFAVASKKRNRDFHQLFRSVPEDDYLIEDYSCALQREIILAGRIYVSEGHICFSSNILGWITTVIISFDEIVSVEKENTAMVFPNAIAIQTLHSRQTFRSLLSREATYELLIGIWKLSHPSLKSSLNGVRLDAGGTGDKTEKVDPTGSEDPSDISEEEEEVYDEDEDEGEDEGLGSFTEGGDGSFASSEDNDPSTYRSIAKKASAMGVAIGSAAGGVPTSGDGKAGEKAVAAAAASVDFPGPASHAPTECSDGDTHYEKVVKDDVIAAPLGKVYSMMFGPASGGFMTRWFIDDQKMMDLQMEDDRKGLSEENRTRSYSYIKPLYASIGPKQTKCLITETLDSIDLEKAVSITVVTQTPDVPSGNIFSTKTKFCLTWAPGNSTRLFINCTIDWTGKSWLKGPIEKGANDGQAAYASDLVKALKIGVLSRSRAGTTSSKPKIKGKRKKADTDVSRRPLPIDRAKESQIQLQQKNDTWGFLEPLHGPLGPIVDIFGSLITANMIIGFLIFLLFLSWFRTPSSPARAHVGFSQMTTPERLAAYEEIWRREESSLWDWLEERIGMEGIAYPTSFRGSDQEAVMKARLQREQSLKHRGIRENLAAEKMSKREVDDAIRVTEERLEVLKNTVKKMRRKDEN